MNHIDELRPVKLQVSCLHIRHKLMYCDSRHDVPGMVDDSSSTRVFFCARSQESLGPDGAPVHPSDCTRARNCYCHGGPSEPSTPSDGADQA
jgi:hypothetical protein